MKEKEIVRVSRGILGTHLAPANPDHHPLLTELFCGNAEEHRKPLELSIEETIQEVKDVAKGMGITVSICGDRKKRPVIQLWKAPRAPAGPVKRIFEGFGGRDAGHWGLTDLSEGHEKALREAVASSDPFTTGWFGTKKELHSANITRATRRGHILVQVSTEMDEPEDLVDTAFWEAAGRNEFSNSGRHAMEKLGLDEERREALVEELTADVVASTSTESTLHWRCGFNRLMEELDKSASYCDGENEAAYQMLVESCKHVIKSLKRAAKER